MAKTKAVYYGIANETTIPFLEIDNSKGHPEVKSGILKNIANALFKELGVQPTLVLLPQKRVGPDLVAGEISAVCFVHEKWFPKEYESQLLWSKEIGTNTNYIVSLGKKPVTKIKDLYGKQVGGIVNYFYENLDPFFAKGLIHRENAPNTESNVEKLIHGRIDYILISNLEYAYYKKKYPQLEAYDLHLDTVQVKCAVSKKAGIDMADLNKAIEILKKNGTFEKIFKP